MAVGLFFALASSSQYTSNASIIPEYELQDRVNEIIESYGLLFGLTGSIRENRTPSYLLRLYPHMINSVDFKRTLMSKPFQYGSTDSSVTLHQYFTQMYRPPLLNSLYDYTFGLPGKILSAMQSGETSPPASTAQDTSQSHQQSDFPILDLSPSERQVARAFSSRITATYDRQTGIVRISARMPEANTAPQVVQLVLETLHEKASDYKTAKGRQYLDFLESQQLRQKQQLDKARQELIEFNGADSQPLNRRMELQSTYETALDQYNTLTQQLQRMRLNIEEQMPTFRILDDITTPGTQIKPKRKLMIFLSLLLGFFVAFSWITISFLLKESEKIWSS
ncbi:GNVR domain-containing protein [Fodinibius salsisoli]|uniref:Tyrosine-protein kinase G-rich domain-containing protein n=1 Tax=Fodinibius salsisoli TaxID=2820877 RepID=A0ABT3PTL1_9BACT|nr:GNVR domain-containing protein [Fodinibius salsisoli]MCW9709181.1 hypothetical protein [Fodinibius salsisoli]